MSTGASRAVEQAAKLRIAFDRAFAEPLRVETAVEQELLAIRIGSQSCAIRLSEISGLYAGKAITPVPGGHAALLGIAGFRGRIVPVYDLRIPLGEAGGGRPRWLVIAAAAAVALAFDALDQHLSVRPEAILPQPRRPNAPGYAREFVQTRNFAGPILHLRAVLQAFNVCAAGAGSLEER